ncbi:MAG: hypothetical protein QOE71_1423 [Pseudonocardiales bacterium]|jgi:hypothetical protein|nr:hypothetical protein [Pseudonocardiales bacterium]MDQ1750367.1 hypothetical protein [Pseudonocardiales bacterium]
MTRNTVYRSMHDLGLAAWFGGTLANAVALNTAASVPSKARDRGQVANVGWDRWTPVNAAAIGTHLFGATGLLWANKQRLVGQEGVASMATAKTGLTLAALGVTAYSRLLGRRVSAHADVPVESATAPAENTPTDVAKAQQQLRMLQWAVPGLSGALIVISAFAGEQQRGHEALRGLRNRFMP